MLDELFELFDRDKRHRKRPGGLRARFARAIAGEEHRFRPVERGYDHDDDESRDRHRSTRSRFDDAFDFD